MNWLLTLLDPNGFLFHVVGIVALTILLATGTPSAPQYVAAEWGALSILLGITIGTGTQVLTSSKKEPPA